LEPGLGADARHVAQEVGARERRGHRAPERRHRLRGPGHELARDRADEPAPRLGADGGEDRHEARGLGRHPAVTARSSVGSDAGTSAEATARSISPEPAVIACTTPETNSPPARSPWLARPESSCARSSFVDALTAKRAICASAVLRPADEPGGDGDARVPPGRA
jgi:hypothetical protein